MLKTKGRKANLPRSVNITTEVAGIKFKNPVLTAAGPPSRNGRALKEAFEGGAGGLVAKTISVAPASVPRPCMVLVDRGETLSHIALAMDNRLVHVTKSAIKVPIGLLNAELWSDLPYEQWVKTEYGVAKETGLPLIASIGYKPEEVEKLGPLVEKSGVDGIEFSTHYLGMDPKPVVEVAKILKESVEIPIFAKLSPHVIEVAEFAKALEKAGVDGITAINTIGPCLHIDVETGKPALGGENGFGWLSGPSIRPIAVRCVAEIARSVKIPVIGVGGIMSGANAIEHIMAGASAVQICTGAILEGSGIFGRVAHEIDQYLVDHGHDSIKDICGIALKHLPPKPLRPETLLPTVDEKLCKVCGLCNKYCIYGAVELSRASKASKPKVTIKAEKCYGCGACVSICPTRALRFEERTK